MREEPKKGPGAPAPICRCLPGSLANNAPRNKPELPATNVEQLKVLLDPLDDLGHRTSASSLTREAAPHRRPPPKSIVPNCNGPDRAALDRSGTPGAPSNVMKHSVRGSWLLLLQFWVVCGVPLLHALQERAGARQEVAIGTESGPSHGGPCAICALISTPTLPGAAAPTPFRTEFLLAHTFVSSAGQPHASPSHPWGARAPPLS
jgi:hypothetical protein